jgi:hypothetical protein
VTNLIVDAVGNAARTDPFVARRMAEIFQLVRPNADFMSLELVLRVANATLKSRLLHADATVPSMPPSSPPVIVD